jgi:hypothetical protein
LVERLWVEVDEEVNEPLDRLLAKAAENERLNLQPGADMNGKRVISHRGGSRLRRFYWRHFGD